MVENDPQEIIRSADPQRISELIAPFLHGELERGDPFASEEERKKWAARQNLHSYIQTLREEREILRDGGQAGALAHVKDELMTAELNYAQLLFDEDTSPPGQ